VLIFVTVTSSSVAPLLAAQPVGAKAMGSPQMRSAQPPCVEMEPVVRTYDSCALYFSAHAIRRGMTGSIAASQLRWGVLPLTKLVQGDSALYNARLYESHQRRAGIVGSVSGLVAVAGYAAFGYLVLNHGGGSDEASRPPAAVTGAIIVGSAGLLVSVGLGEKARARAARSIWWYNRSLER